MLLPFWIINNHAEPQNGIDLRKRVDNKDRACVGLCCRPHSPKLRTHFNKHRSMPLHPCEPRRGPKVQLQRCQVNRKKLCQQYQLHIDTMCHLEGPKPGLKRKKDLQDVLERSDITPTARFSKFISKVILCHHLTSMPFCGRQVSYLGPTVQ